MWVELNSKLKSILEANDKIQEVYDYEEGQFEGGPAVTLSPSGNESDYSTTTTNERVYAFIVRVFVDRTERNAINCERVMRELVDTIIDDFDKNYTLTGIDNPTGKTLMYVEALPSLWGYVDGQISYRVAEIAIRCHVDVDVTLIS